MIYDVARAPVRRFRKLSGHVDEPERFWALRDVSFEVKPGEVLGVIGRNGAGKSTLLKVLSRITEPTTGRIEIRGRVGCLLEVGTGFHPELTGRENIYLNGAILGMQRREISRKFDEIVDFFGVEKFLDTPVKRYSSGMRCRLAFSVAAHLDLEVVLVDEVLAVGDADFQRKCLGKMEEVAHSGRTVLFVSHNMAAVQSLCTSAMLLKEGRIAMVGDTPSVTAAYLDDGGSTSCDVDLSEHPGRPPGMASILRRLRITDLAGNPVQTVPVGTAVRFEIELDVPESVPQAAVALRFHNSVGQCVLSCRTVDQYAETIELDGKSIISCIVDDIRLVPGVYHVELLLSSANTMLDAVRSGLSIEVASSDIYGTGRTPEPKHGFYLASAEWSLCDA